MIESMVQYFLAHNQVFWLCCAVICLQAVFLLYIFIAFRTYVSILKSFIEHNKTLGFGIGFSFGWRGVQITPVPKTLPTSENPIIVCRRSEKTKIDMNGRCLWNFFLSSRSIGVGQLIEWRYILSCREIVGSVYLVRKS